MQRFARSVCRARDLGTHFDGGDAVQRRVVLTATMLLCITYAVAEAAGKLTFWNLTSQTVTSLSLAAPNSGKWGPNQCTNDNDGTVDHDERLRLSGIAPGRYDVRISDRTRTCIVRSVEVHGDRPYAFSLSDEDLRDCTPAK